MAELPVIAVSAMRQAKRTRDKSWFDAARIHSSGYIGHASLANERWLASVVANHAWYSQIHLTLTSVTTAADSAILPPAWSNLNICYKLFGDSLHTSRFLTL